MKKIYSILLLIVSFNCFSVDLQSGEKYGTVSFYRPAALMGIALKVEIMINQSVIGTIKSGEYIEFNLDPGVYLIHQYSVLADPSPAFNVFKLVVEEGERTSYSVKTTAYTKPDNLEEITKEPELKESENVRWIEYEEA